MRNRWIYCLAGAGPFWIWTYLDFRARSAEAVKWALPDNGGDLASTAMPTAVILTAAGVFMLLFDFNNRPNS
jgi:hypothetical protein